MPATSSKRQCCEETSVARPTRRAAAEDRAARLWAWLRERGCDLDGIEIRPDNDGGLGVFATKALAEGSAIGGLPGSAVLDPREALRLPLAQRALSSGASPPFALWLTLADGLHNDKHPFHGYLASLPDAAPDPCAWSREQRALLGGTPLAKQVESQRRLLRAEFERIVPAIAVQQTSPPLCTALLVHESESHPCRPL